VDSELGDQAALHLHFGRDLVVEASPRDTVATALLRAGQVACTRSPKYRRARGPYCLLGDCGSCQVRIDGQPNIRACTTAVRDGLHVAPQNHWGPTGLDPTGMIDHVFAGGIDHHHMMVKPRVLNQLMQATARSLTGFGTLPDQPPQTPARHREHRPEVLVIGAGHTGRAIACALEAANVDVCTLDRRDRLALETWSDAPLPSNLLTETGVFAAYPTEGKPPDDSRWVAASSPLATPRTLHSLYPKHVVLAVGGRDPMLLLPRNDLPGVVSARGLVHMLKRTQRSLPGPIVVIAEQASRGQRFLNQLQAQLPSASMTYVPLAEVVELRGSDRVTGVQTKTQVIDCQFVALAPIPAPAHELASMAGAPLRFDGHGYAVVTDAHGRCATTLPSGWRLWACGDVCGHTEAPSAEASQKLAHALIQELKGDTP